MSRSHNRSLGFQSEPKEVAVMSQDRRARRNSLSNSLNFEAMTCVDCWRRPQ